MINHDVGGDDDAVVEWSPFLPEQARGEVMSNMSLVAPLFILFSGVGLFVLLCRRIMILFNS